MRRTILTVGKGECRYPVTEDAPFELCGDPVGDETTSYCVRHHLLCYKGFGVDPRAIEQMMYQTDSTMVRLGATKVTSGPQPVDEVVG